MSTLIQPTNGRIIWFTPAKGDTTISFTGTPLAAIIAAVNTDATINICAFDIYGIPHARCNVPIRNAADEMHPSGYYAEWMPYQEKQARRAADELKLVPEPSSIASPVTKILGRADQPGEQALEAELKAKGLDAPRLSPELIDNAIAKQDFYVFPGTTLTVCCLTLVNGFNVTGTSAAASPANFDAEVGRRIASANARDKVWELEGYRLRQALYERDNGFSDVESAEPGRASPMQP